jgi:ParB/RepB/Spo0J family partition protein
MEGKFINIPVDKIVSESNRTHGGMGSIDILAESIAQTGLQNPPLVVECDGNYRVVAGRRRVEAVRKLKIAEITVQVISETDEDALSEIALSENVNRAEMHPLDEAALFKGLLARLSVKKIAEQYDRTEAAIKHRIRLCSLNDDIKAIFRREGIKLSSASLLASLPDEDQVKFAEKFNDTVFVNSYVVANFVHNARNCVIKHIADDECAACGNRTYNTEPGLFEDEFASIEDVCFDGDCYARHWSNKIAALIAERNIETETNIIFEWSVPHFYPKNAESISIGGTDYTVLEENKILYKPTGKNPVENTAWLISTKPVTEAVRVEYSEREISQGRYVSDPVQEFRLDLIPELDGEQRKSAGAKLKEKYSYSSWRFFDNIKETMLREIVMRRIKEESRENMAALYVRSECSGHDDEGNFMEFEEEDDFLLFKEILGIEHTGDIAANEHFQKIFLFLVARSFGTRDMPNAHLAEENSPGTENILFMKFAQMSYEEYTALFLEKLREAVSAETAEPEKQDEE